MTARFSGSLTLVEPMDTADEARFERLARELKDAGYTGAVTARKLISEHGADEDYAVALVERVYGRPVDPRQGQILLDFLVGGPELALGLVGVWLLGFEGLVVEDSGVLAIIFCVDGARRLFLGLMRIVAREDLGQRPSD